MHDHIVRHKGDRVVVWILECHGAQVLFIHEIQRISHAEQQVSSISHMPNIIAEENDIHTNGRCGEMLSPASTCHGCVR